jgi:membrane protease YdiL (CAAX protease family)
VCPGFYRFSYPLISEEEDTMVKTYQYKPVLFYVIVFAITWISWFLAAIVSYQEGAKLVYMLLMIPGLVAPAATALWMILNSNSPELKKQFTDRLFNLRLIKPISILPLLTIMPATVVISALVSMIFGQPASQFQFAEGFPFSASYIPMFIIITLAAIFEELGWRGYAMDSLNVKRNFFNTTLIFAVLWGLWHVPLFFINGYYHNVIIKANVIYGINFLVSVIPMAFLISWMWKWNHRYIPIAILFHLVTNVSQEALQVTQITKCIETLLLILIAAVVVFLNRKMFFEKEK